MQVGEWNDEDAYTHQVNVQGLASKRVEQSFAEQLRARPFVQKRTCSENCAPELLIPTRAFLQY